ncbi:hypothetical protein HDU67_004774 [Dinochytrium kinnereticum]|nr:hypothetical protein HDU67_004774 [Dinochytrium kinnereticum]
MFPLTCTTPLDDDFSRGRFQRSGQSPGRRSVSRDTRRSVSGDREGEDNDDEVVVVGETEMEVDVDEFYEGGDEDDGDFEGLDPDLWPPRRGAGGGWEADA